MASEKEKSESGQLPIPAPASKPQGKVSFEAKVTLELDQEKLECLNGPGLTTTVVVVT